MPLFNSFRFQGVSSGSLALASSLCKRARNDSIPNPSITRPVTSIWAPMKYRMTPLSSYRGAHIRRFAKGVPSLRLSRLVVLKKKKKKKESF